SISTSGTVTNPDFDLFLFDPNGNQVASSEFQMRQEDLGYKPTITGTYTLRVLAFRGSGGYFVDISRPPVPAYEVPAAASTMNVSLVPTFTQCGSGANPANGVHSPPLGVPACEPPR